VSSETHSIRVRVLFFGPLKEVTGEREQVVELKPGSRIDELFADFVARQPELGRYRTSLVASRNQEFAAWSTLLESGDEVAFLPPVSGG
jgi:molybdopterin converting factor small subunit